MIETAELFWISGSPPSWRVMLGLTLKGIPFTSRRLDHGAGENKKDAYLALNPKGQVPTLVHGDTVIRESIAILAYLDRAWQDRPIFGATASKAATIWQDVMVFEADLAPAGRLIAPTLLRGMSAARRDELGSATASFLAALDVVEDKLAQQPFVSGDAASASDCWLYPALGWVERAIAKTSDPVSDPLARHLSDRPHLSAWHARFGDLPGVPDTYPPHWNN